MAKGMYSVIGGKSRKITKNYAVIGGVTRKIKKIYAVVNGITKLVFGGAEVSYFGTAPALSTKRDFCATANIDNIWVMFAGGYNSSDGFLSSVECYNYNLTKGDNLTLGASVRYLASTTVGNYALFGGGENDSSAQTYVTAFNAELTRSIKYLSTARYMLAAATIGNYALFAGGVTNSANTSAVEKFDTSLTKSTATSLSAARDSLASTTVGNYALFGGGDYYSSVVDAYNTSATRSTATSLSVGRRDFAATTVGSYALFGGGTIKSITQTTTVDAYNASLTRSTITALSTARDDLTATTVGDYALFGGGYTNMTTYGGPACMATVDVYDSSLTRTTTTPLSVARYGLTAVSIDSYALFGGGNASANGYSNVVDVYQIG